MLASQACKVSPNSSFSINDLGSLLWLLVHCDSSVSALIQRASRSNYNDLSSGKLILEGNADSNEQMKLFLSPLNVKS